MKNVILLLTKSSSQVIINQYNKLKTELNPEKYDIFILYHDKINNIPNIIKNENYFSFNNNILQELNFKPIGKFLLPGSNHFPLFKFKKIHSEYKYYWVIEDDVRFNGNWNTFFSKFEYFNCDFLSSDIRNYIDDSSWCYFNSLSHPIKKIEDKNKIASFNPIYRISNNSIDYLSDMFLDGWSGHHEVSISTLLNYGGFHIADFGGNGKYTPDEFKNKNYNINDSKTHIYRPIFTDLGNITDVIYHPVKNFKNN